MGARDTVGICFAVALVARWVLVAPFFCLLVVAFALMALLGARGTVGTFVAVALVALLGGGGSVGALVLVVWHAWCLRVGGVCGCWRHRCLSFELRC